MASSTKKLLSLLSLPLVLVSFSIYISTGSHVKSPDEKPNFWEKFGGDGKSQSDGKEHEAGSLMTLTIYGIDVNFRWAPAGTFQMVSPASESGRAKEETLHKVTLSHGFWLAETETTQELWQAVMENNPSENRAKDLPVENVSWADCQRFLNALNWKYNSSLPDGYKFALPTEAQWEYACRAGTTTPFNCGDSLNVDNANSNDTLHANSQGAAINESTPVKNYAPNAWGLYDMHGNVHEFCSDRCDPDHYKSEWASKDPLGPLIGDLCVVRGGSWKSADASCRSAFRAAARDSVKRDDLGFRIALVPAEDRSNIRYEQAQQALKSKAYLTSKAYIEEAMRIQPHTNPEYKHFRNVTLAEAINDGVNQAIAESNGWRASSLCELLVELDYPVSNATREKISELGNSAPQGTSSDSGSISEIKPFSEAVVNQAGESISSHESSSSEVLELKDEPASHEMRNESVAQEVENEAEVDEVDNEPGAVKTLNIAGVNVNFRWAPAGKFLMGSPESEQGRWASEKQHEVELTHGFWIAETETTQDLWQSAMANNPSKSKDDNQLPVESLSWNDCRDFVKTLNTRYGKVLPRGYKYAMPTEAQWEYACRAGTSTAFNFGDRYSDGKVNCNGSVLNNTSVKGSPYGQKTLPVKKHAPNDWGLYDMHGNVWEWCADFYDEDYYASASAAKDPVGATNGRSRVLRGGSGNDDALFCRSAYRGDGAPDEQYERFGFRLVLVQVSQPEAPESAPDATEDEPLVDDESEASREAGTVKTLTISGVKVNFRWAPAGTFQMGSPQSEPGHGSAETQHDVTLSKGFWIAETETTQELWTKVMDKNPSRFRYHGSGDKQLPVEKVSWFDCRDFVNKLNGLYCDCLPSGYQFGMPTEAQWEYACRAGTTTPFNFTESMNESVGVLSNGVSALNEKQDHPNFVKSYPPNAWGLYDMHGNVEEWALDWYERDYYKSESAAKDPTGPSKVPTWARRVKRGGSWKSSSEYCRSAKREEDSPDKQSDSVGFRLVLIL